MNGQLRDLTFVLDLEKWGKNVDSVGNPHGRGVRMGLPGELSPDTPDETTLLKGPSPNLLAVGLFRLANWGRNGVPGRVGLHIFTET